MVGFCLALSGEEITKMVLHGLIEYFEVGGRHKNSHVIISLLGRFKNEVRELYHLLLVATTPKSGIKVQSWVECLLIIRN